MVTPDPDLTAILQRNTLSCLWPESVVCRAELLVGLDMAIVNHPCNEAGPESRKGAQQASLGPLE